MGGAGDQAEGSYAPVTDTAEQDARDGAAPAPPLYVEPCPEQAELYANAKLELAGGALDGFGGGATSPQDE